MLSDSTTGDNGECFGNLINVKYTHRPLVYVLAWFLYYLIDVAVLFQKLMGSALESDDIVHEWTHRVFVLMYNILSETNGRIILPLNLFWEVCGSIKYRGIIQFFFHLAIYKYLSIISHFRTSATTSASVPLGVTIS